MSTLGYFQHKKVCAAKQRQRDDRFEGLPKAYKGPITSQQISILDRPIAELVKDVQNGTTSPIDILRAYGKVAAIAQKKTNAVTEILLPEAEQWVEDGEINLKGPLAGIPVSLKDTLGVRGFDVSVGYSMHCNKPWPEDGVMVKLLKKAGAIPHVKTACPITLLSFESTNDVWGVAKNPHNPKYSPGGSTGGEGALLALNGSRIGIGSDVAGSVRVPAAWSGIFSLRCSTGRWPKLGANTSMPGQEGIPAVFSPMCRTLDDLTYFTKSFIQMKPWEVDYTVHPIPWRQAEYDDTLAKKLRVGVMRSDGVIPPTPAIAHGIDTTAYALEKAGHTIVDITPSDFPKDASPLHGLRIASTLLCADGGQMYRSFFSSGESTDPGAAQLHFYGYRLPGVFRYLHYLWVRYVNRDSVWSFILRHFRALSAYENWQWVKQREAFRLAWFEWLSKPEQSFDFILCPVNATPALPHGAMHDAVSSCGYTFLWNLLDYSAGVVPITHVDPLKDSLHPDFKAQAKKSGTWNAIMAGAYKYYDAEKMKGLPVAVQVVGGTPFRLSEEKTLACMQVVQDSLKDFGVVYEHLDIQTVAAEVYAQEMEKS